MSLLTQLPPGPWISILEYTQVLIRNRLEDIRDQLRLWIVAFAGFVVGIGSRRVSD